MVKNFFLNIVKLKEKVFSLLLPKYKFLFLAILFFAILWPLYFAAAQIFGLDLGNLVANAIFLLFFRIFIEIGNLILQISLLILNWVLSDNFIPWSYTNANNNPIINIGWQITRDLANMSFIVILVAIGLGTALKLQEYQVQKTLPTLILIALLINFTPVLLGLMVDAANITMNFFLESVSGLDAWGRVSEAQAAVIIQTLVRGGIVLGLIPAIFQAMLIFVINLLSAAIIIAFAGLFMIRYIAIWILVILSPIVFAMYILPGTRKMYWNQWWSQFTQWTIIGIPAAFFLYLGNHIMIDAPGMNLNPPSGGIWDITFLTFIRAIMPYIIALMFLWIGFFVALTSSAMGASGVIQTVQKGGRAAGGWAKKKGLKMAGDRARKIWEESERLRPAMENKAKQLAMMQGVGKPTWGAGQTGIGGWVKRRAATATIAGRIPLNVGVEAGRKVGRTGFGISETGKKQIDQAEQETEKMSVEMVVSMFRSATDWATKTGYLKRLAKKGDIDKALEKGLKESEIGETIHRSGVYGDQHEDILAAAPQMITPIISQIAARHGITPEEVYSRKINGEIFSGSIGTMKADRAGFISKSVYAKDPATGNFKHPAILTAMIKSWDGNQLGKFLAVHGSAGGTAIEERITQLATAAGVTPRAWLDSNNKKLLKYITHSPLAAGLIDIP